MRIILATLCLMSANNAAVAETPALTNLQVFPPDIKLQSNRGRQSFVDTAMTRTAIIIASLMRSALGALTWRSRRKV